MDCPNFDSKLNRTFLLSNLPEILQTSEFTTVRRSSNKAAKPSVLYNNCVIYSYIEQDINNRIAMDAESLFVSTVHSTLMMHKAFNNHPLVVNT